MSADEIVSAAWMFGIGGLIAVVLLPFYAKDERRWLIICSLILLWPVLICVLTGMGLKAYLGRWQQLLGRRPPSQ